MSEDCNKPLVCCSQMQVTIHGVGEGKLPICPLSRGIVLHSRINNNR